MSVEEFPITVQEVAIVAKFTERIGRAQRRSNREAEKHADPIAEARRRANAELIDRESARMRQRPIFVIRYKDAKGNVQRIPGEYSHSARAFQAAMDYSRQLRYRGIPLRAAGHEFINGKATPIGVAKDAERA